MLFLQIPVDNIKSDNVNLSPKNDKPHIERIFVQENLLTDEDDNLEYEELDEEEENVKFMCDTCSAKFESKNKC